MSHCTSRQITIPSCTQPGDDHHVGKGDGNKDDDEDDDDNDGDRLLTYLLMPLDS